MASLGRQWPLGESHRWEGDVGREKGRDTLLCSLYMGWGWRQLLGATQAGGLLTKIDELMR